MKFFNWLPPAPQVSLDQHRLAIDKIDLQLVGLLGYRFHHILEIIQIKKIHKIPIEDEDRNLQIKKNIERIIHLHNLPVEDEIQNIFKSIIQQSIEYQKKLMPSHDTGLKKK